MVLTYIFLFHVFITISTSFFVTLPFKPYLRFFGESQHSENEDHGIRSHHFMGNRWGNSGNSVRLYFGGAPKSLQMVTAAMKLKDAYSLEEKL